MCRLHGWVRLVYRWRQTTLNRHGLLVLCLSVCLFVSFEDYDIIARVRVLFVDSL